VIVLMHVILGGLTFLLGTVIGSFLNVCIYRIPWQKSVIWPRSCCPHCSGMIASSDNIPVVSWLVLRGECRRCGGRISARYPLVELLVGLLFLAVYLVDVARPGLVFAPPPDVYLQMAYHLLLVTFLVMASFIDYDLVIIPDAVTVTGMVFGLTLGTLFPGIRPDPGHALTHGAGLWTGVVGLVVGGGIVWLVRIAGGLAFGREAMGFGDVTLMAMIGTFLGWQATVLTFFLSAFVALVPALAKMVLNAIKRLSGGQLSGADREIPFGPFISMAAVILLLAWPWLWPGWASGQFGSLRVVFLFLIGQDV
jgi:leader peptidase (prepilin peptidase)/N-methyltransferase